MSAWYRWGAWAGVAAPLLFVVLVVAQMLAKPTHDPVAWPMSALAAGEDGWVQNLNFFATGTLLAVFGLALHRVLPRGGTRAWGPALLVVSGLAMLWAGAFPLGQSGQPFDPDAGPGLHVVGGVLFFTASGAALLVLSWRLAQHEAWRDRAALVRWLGVTMLLVFVAMSALVTRPGAPLDGYAGVFQAVGVTAWAVGVGAVALRATAAAAQQTAPEHTAGPPA